tara:strand:- start:506 stop:745 length:240 start_codon:yes stop_codon:yes gene_type:complete
METTIIQVKKDTAKLLKSLKLYSRQSYDEIIRNLVQESKAEALTEKEKKDIEEALQDIREGKVYPIEDVAEELGVKLSN